MGWGVRTGENIPKGKFICEYVGEIITSEEADRRAKHDEVYGTTYLFDLDSEVLSTETADFTIDARHFGNVSHFINHSCNPNIEIRAVFIEHWDKRLHRLAFFANKDITKGEEITFDYNPVHSTNNNCNDKSIPESSTKASKNGLKQFKCHCGSPACRDVIFT